MLYRSFSYGGPMVPSVSYVSPPVAPPRHSLSSVPSYAPSGPVVTRQYSSVSAPAAEPLELVYPHQGPNDLKRYRSVGVVPGQTVTAAPTVRAVASYGSLSTTQSYLGAGPAPITRTTSVVVDQYVPQTFDLGSDDIGFMRKKIRDLGGIKSELEQGHRALDTEESEALAAAQRRERLETTQRELLELGKQMRLEDQQYERRRSGQLPESDQQAESAEVRRLVGELVAARTALEDTKKRLSQSDAALSQAERRAYSAEARLHSAQQEATDGHVRELNSGASATEALQRAERAEAQLRDSEARLRDCEARLSDSEAQLRDAEGRIRQAEGAVAREHGENEAELRTLQRQLAEEQERAQEAEASAAQLRLQLARATEGAADASQIQALQAELEASQSRARSLAEDLAESRVALAASKDRISELDRELAAARAASRAAGADASLFAELQEQFRVLSEQNAALRDQLGEASSEREAALRELTTEHFREAGDLQLRLDEAEAERDALSSQLVAIQALLDDAEKRAAAAEQSVSDAQAQQETAERQLRQLEQSRRSSAGAAQDSQLADARDRIESLEMQLDSMRIHHGELQRECDEKDQTIASLQSFKTSVEEKLLIFQSDSSLSESELRGRITKLAETLAENEKRVPTLKQDQEKFKTEIASLRESVSAKSLDRLHELQILLFQSESELREIKSMTGVLTAELWQAKFEEIKRESSGKLAVGPESETRIDRVSQNNKEATQAISTLVSTHESLREELAEQKDSMASVFVLMKGEVMLKFTKKTASKPHRRFFFVHVFSEPTLFWNESEGGEAPAQSAIAAVFRGGDYRQSTIHYVIPQPHDEIVKSAALTPEILKLCFQIGCSDRRIDLIAPNETVFATWTAGLQQMLDKFRAGRLGGSSVTVSKELSSMISRGSGFDFLAEKMRAEAFEKQKLSEEKRQLDEMMASLQSHSKRRLSVSESK
eukprot:TRINITY_DN2036_c0_g1_i1.p1 TRINITY_DN2036_c0_g1~~TRINITY_DN2036_c0_g1_i1.p1  ORF type:complete len:957 (-),score=244.02 TRINITY_DN2036_c0_g1_i1:71-2941(-)